MKYFYKPKNKLEQFGFLIYNVLVENFPQTFYVGGTVRDILLKKNITDIDIATTATPQQVSSALKKHYIEHNNGYQNFGVIVALKLPHKVAITTLRKDLRTTSRYPVVSFTKSLKVDSQRRDFTINALYLSLSSGKITDFYNGQLDLKNSVLKFIGTPSIRIQQDPLRIVRALRFSLVYNFTIENATYEAIKKYFILTKKITTSRLETEIKKIKSEKNKKIILEVINKPHELDKFFKKT